MTRLVTRFSFLSHLTSESFDSLRLASLLVTSFSFQSFDSLWLWLCDVVCKLKLPPVACVQHELIHTERALALVNPHFLKR